MPAAGGRIVLTPTPNGGYRTDHKPLEDPMAAASEEERRFFTEHSDYSTLSRLELMRRLRGAEWNAAHYQAETERLQRQAHEMPPLHRVKEMHGRLQRVRELLAVPRRRSIPRDELVSALEDPFST